MSSCRKNKLGVLFREPAAISLHHILENRKPIVTGASGAKQLPMKGRWDVASCLNGITKGEEKK